MGPDDIKQDPKPPSQKLTRRDFVVTGGSILAGGALANIGRLDEQTVHAAEKTSYPRSTGYLVYDSRLCSGCQTCMLVCSLVHEGVISASLARIQVSRAVLNRYPYDIQIAVCRQCPDPLCVSNCPTGACHISAAHGNVRMIDSQKCVGCQTCLSACPYSPHRTIWNPESKKATKCDLCAQARYFNKKGGPSGSQACVAACPMGALKLVNELPAQRDTSGYDINLAPAPKPKSMPGAPPEGAAPEAKPSLPASKPL